MPKALSAFQHSPEQGLGLVARAAVWFQSWFVSTADDATSDSFFDHNGTRSFIEKHGESSAEVLQSAVAKAMMHRNKSAGH